uniref:Uncharacterized protein n=1 Tax=Arundo donax TaxID=35708 RepID=A0A0A9GCN3_ARUDO
MLSSCEYWHDEFHKVREGQAISERIATLRLNNQMTSCN